MSVTYKASRALRIYRKIQCEACDQTFDYIATETFRSEHTAYSYITQRSVEKQTKEEVQKAYDKRVNTIEAEGNDAVLEAKPCPNCGYHQSYMVGARKRHGVMFTSGGVGSMLFAGLTLLAEDVPIGVVQYFLVGLGAILLAIGVYFLATPLNRKWLKEHGKTKRDVPPPRKPLETKIL